MKIGMGLLAFCCAVLSYAGAATAQDDVGAVGSVAGLQINTAHGDSTLIFQGRIYVATAGGTLDEYRWGGQSCLTKVLSADEVAALQRALDNKKVQIQPLSKPGQGDIKCLVGFLMVPKKYISDVIP